MFECTIKGCREPAIELQGWVKAQEDFQVFMPVCPEHAKALHTGEIWGSGLELTYFVGILADGNWEKIPARDVASPPGFEIDWAYNKRPEPEVCDG